MIERLIGIDFGTSTTVIKIKTYENDMPIDADNAVVFVSFDNRPTLPTLVFETNTGDSLVGYEAENPAVKGTIYQNFKLDLVGTDENLKKQAVRHTRIFFDYICKVYNAQKSHFPTCDKETTYISYPAKWPLDLQKLMLEIATDAGFLNVQGLDEPSAAIHTVLINDNEKIVLGGDDYANILMIDMGAGTTDLVLCEYSPYEKTNIRVLATWPQAGAGSFFGGREIDEKLCDHIKEYLVKNGLPNASKFQEKYLDKCKAWKEANLSPIFKDKNGVVRYCGFIDAIMSMLGIDDEFPPISRDDFENMLADYMSQFPQLINDCIRSVNFDPAQLDYVILTGGHSGWYFADEILSNKITKFGEVNLPKIMSDEKRIIRLAKPQETVALGLVYHKTPILLKDRPSIKVTGIINILAGRYIAKHGVDLLADSTALKRLEDAAKKAVKEIESKGKVDIEVPYISANATGSLNLKEAITKEELLDYIKRYPEQDSGLSCSGCSGAINPTDVYCPQCGMKVQKTTDKNDSDSTGDAKVACPACKKINPGDSVYCGYCGQDMKKAARATLGSIFKTLISNSCPVCKKQVPLNADFCGHCGNKIKPDITVNNPISYIPTAKSDHTITRSGSLLQTLSGAGYYRDIQQVMGTISIYDNKITFKASALNMLAAIGASHDVLMADIISVQRHKIMGTNACIKINTLQGKDFVYSVGLTNAGDIPDIIELISRYKGV